MMSTRNKISIKAKYANPTFLRWLREWKDAEENPLKKQIYNKALKSLMKFPLPLKTGQECYILQGFNKKLCKKLDDKLKIHSSTSEAGSSSTSNSKQTNVKGVMERKKDSRNTAATISSDEVQIFPGNSFEICLFVDTHEIANASDQLISCLNKLCVNYEIRHLHVGDFAWVCRQKRDGLELVLPYIMERKRLDDFNKSIKDGRFHEQKFRLKQSKIEHLMYLVESTARKPHFGIPLTSIYQAATNTLLHDRFLLKFTNNVKETAEYLGMFTKILERKYSCKTLMACSVIDSATPNDGFINLMRFKDFNAHSTKSKNLNVSDIFVKQLIQLHGVSVSKALAIVDKFATPRTLMFAYEACTSEEQKENLLKDIEFGTLNKRIGVQISRSLYLLFCKQ